MPLNKVHNPSEYGDLRPLSILPIFSKVLERIMLDQLSVYVNMNSILPGNQSGFRAGHSCSSALLNILDDILRAHDNNRVTVLVLLDFTKAFDTINHDLLLSKLRYFGLSGSAIELIHSFLDGRSQYVSLSDNCSSIMHVASGVPQGSILSPLLYSLYTSGLQDSISYCNYHFYADDTQLYYSFLPKETEEANIKINEDLNSLATAAGKHSLKINPNKSSVLIFGPTEAVSCVRTLLNVKVDGKTISIVDSAKNLGVIIDSQLKFGNHVKNLIQKAFFKLKLLYSSRHFFDSSTKRFLCDSLILSNFNYCYEVYGVFLSHFWQSKLQRVQNCCLRFIYSIRKHQHISHTLTVANWLNMKNRLHYHTVALIHRVLTEKKPSYLHRKIKFRTDIHNVNIRRKNLICCPKHKLQIFKRSFTYLAFKLYNSIPHVYKLLSVNKFKVQYKQRLLDMQN